MTVAELITELQKFPDHWQVYAMDGMGLSGEATIEPWEDEDSERIWITG